MVENNPLAHEHNHGISPCSMGNTSSKGPFSLAILVYQSVKSKCPVHSKPHSYSAGLQWPDQYEILQSETQKISATQELKKRST